MCDPYGPRVKNPWIPFDVYNKGFNFYIDHPECKRAVFYLDFKFSINIWDKFCIWFYNKRYKNNKSYWIKKKNIVRNIDAYFTVKLIDGETHYLGWIYKNEE